MTVHVDNLWYETTECVKYVLTIGKKFPNQEMVRVCTMFSDCLSANQAEHELRVMALAIGAQREQKRPGPSYVVTEEQRRAAVNLGAVEIDWRQAQSFWEEEL